MSVRGTQMAALVFAAVWLCAAAASRAEEPAGAYTIPFLGDAALAVPAGGSSDCAEARGIETCLALPLKTNPVGTLTPPDDPNTLTFSVDSPEVTSDLIVTRVGGLLSGTNQKPKAVLEFGASGTVSEGGVTLNALASGSLRCKLDADLADTLACRGKATLCAFTANGDELGCTALPIATRLTLVERPFDLELDLSTDAKGVVTGDALVRFSEDQAMPRTVTGKYNSRNDTATLNLIGFDNGLGSMLTLKGVRFEDETGTGGKVVYKIASQKGAVKLAE
jgi:hypothetical protein